jgi:restriction system protein
MTRVWVVRSEFGKYSDHFVNGGYVAAGWLPTHNLTVFDNREEILQLYKKEHPEEKPRRANANAGMIATFSSDIKPGDYVITPRSYTEWLDYGPVQAESLYYSPNTGDGCPFPHRRKVQWAKAPLRRWDLSIPFQNTLKASKTVFHVSHAEEFLVRIGQVTKRPPRPTNDHYRLIRDRILELDSSEFEDLVKALLEAIGFEETEVTPSSGDGGVDVIGELNIANLAKVKLFVQAKRYKSGKVKEKAVKDLRKVIPIGGQGAVITTSEFNLKAKEASHEAGFQPIGLIDGYQLVDLLIEHWNSEPLAEFHEQLGLKPGLVSI